MNPHFSTLVERYSELDQIVQDIQRAYEVLYAAFAAGNKLLICGNGGSAADSEHIVGELMKGYLLPRRIPHHLVQRLTEVYPEEGPYLADHLQGALPAISLVSQSALISAFSNDVAPDLVFAQQVLGYGRPGDVLLALSTSGNSTNLLHALRVARVIQMPTIGLVGRTGGTMAALCDVAVRVPFDTTAWIQERHLAIYHALCAALEQAFFQEE